MEFCPENTLGEVANWSIFTALASLLLSVTMEKKIKASLIVLN
jgi:hypothetical protein